MTRPVSGINMTARDSPVNRTYPKDVAHPGPGGSDTVPNMPALDNMESRPPDHPARRGSEIGSHFTLAPTD